MMPGSATAKARYHDGGAVGTFRRFWQVGFVRGPSQKEQLLTMIEICAEILCSGLDRAVLDSVGKPGYRVLGAV